MADLFFVFVREDAVRAEALAGAMESANLSVGAGANEAALAASCAGVIVWSDAASRSNSFLAAAQRAMDAGKGVLVCFSPPPSRRIIGDTPTFDVSGWKGDDDDPKLTPLLIAINYIVESKRDEVLADALGARAAGWTADLPETPIGRTSAAVTPLRAAASDEEDLDSSDLVA